MQTAKQALPQLSLPADARLVVVEARYYTDINDALLEGISQTAAHYNVPVETHIVPGALELPLALQFLATRINATPHDAYVVVGCIIRGETTHYETVCLESNAGVNKVSRSMNLPVGNVILTVENEAQAIARAEPQGQDKGGGAALAALTLLQLKNQCGVA